MGLEIEFGIGSTASTLILALRVLNTNTENLFFLTLLQVRGEKSLMSLVLSSLKNRAFPLASSPKNTWQKDNTECKLCIPTSPPQPLRHSPEVTTVNSLFVHPPKQSVGCVHIHTISFLAHFHLTVRFFHTIIFSGHFSHTSTYNPVYSFIQLSNILFYGTTRIIEPIL